MEILTLLIFISSVLAALAVGFFVWTGKTRTYEHLDELSLLPLESSDSAESDPCH